MASFREQNHFCGICGMQLVRTQLIFSALFMALGCSGGARARGVSSTTVQTCVKPQALAPASPEPEAAERARVSAFDCFSALEDKTTQSLRAWQSGGPSGAAWNITGAPLLCRVQLEAPCAGTVQLRLRGNQVRLYDSSWKVEKGSNTIDVNLAAALWEGAIQSGSFAFELLPLSVGDLLVCGDDGSKTYPFADAFVAGLASGE